MKRRLALFAAMLMVAAPAVVLLGSSQAGANVEISYVEHETNIEFVINGQRTLNPTALPGPGDSFIVRDDLLQGATNIGYDNIQCVVTFNNNLLCNGVLSFTGKGDMTVATLLRGAASGN